MAEQISKNVETAAANSTVPYDIQEIEPYEYKKTERNIQNVLMHPDTTTDVDNFLINFNSVLNKNNNLNKNKTEILDKINDVYKNILEIKQKNDNSIIHELYRGAKQAAYNGFKQFKNWANV